MPDKDMVVIVGGGPSGLVTALLLARFGVRSVLVERRPQVSGLPKARGMHARAMEIFRLLGLEATFASMALPLEPIARFQPTLTAAPEREFPTGGEALIEVSPCEGASVSQDVVETVLRARVDAEPLIDARWGARCVGVRVGAGQAEVDVVDPDDGRCAIAARFVVAADGSHSQLRDSLGIGSDAVADFEPQRSVHFRADLSRWVGPRPGAIYMLTASRSVLFWTHADDRWTLTQRNQGEDAPSAVRQSLGVSDLTLDVLADEVWLPGTSCARQLRAGPVFLIGDAAHRVTPAGATGMNMAIQDAHNVAWKLAFVIAGQAGDALLDSYQAERDPVGRVNADDSRTAWIAFARGGQPPPGRGMRETDMGHRYHSTAVIDDNRPDPDPTGVDYQPSATPGRRAPHLWLGANRSTLDLFGTHLSYLAGPSSPAITLPQGVTATAIHHPDFADLYGIAPTGAVLVRPDGHVAARWHSAPETSDVQHAIDTVLSRPHTPSRQAKQPVQ